MSTKILLIVLILSHFDNSLADPLIKLPNGLIQGRQGITFHNKTFYAFEKIPYAAPPVGELRFQAPKPPQNWEGTLNTTHLDVSCHQEGIVGDYESEDCLYINVFTPQLPSEDDNVSLPVMFFIHGGAFKVGSSMNLASDLITDNGVILVTINYRLGPLGFLSTQDEIVPGNNGLKDQLLALQWAHKNINFFGGDPEKITIFGQSAGSASCAYLLLNQQSEGLFRGAILQSGSFLSPWAYQRNARELAFATAALINDTFSTNNDSAELLSFLRTVDANTITAAAEKLQPSPEYNEVYQGLFWAPVIEVKNPNAFITKKMYGLLQANNIVAVPLLIGMTSEESLGFRDITNEKTLTSSMQLYDEHLDYLVSNDMYVTDVTNRTTIGQKIREIYTGGEALVDHLGDGVRLYSDSGFTRPIIKHAELWSQFVETYFYQFSYDGVLGGNDAHYDGADFVGHSEDMFYLFCYSVGCDFSIYPESDQVTSERLVSIWTNFAKYQNPTPEPSELLQNITWPIVSTEGGDFLYVDINENLEIKNHPKEKTYGKWVELYDNLGYDDFDTY